jgi:DNA-binding transcriptional MerR regulator
VQYSIKDIEKLTGIKAHTLRIWEQRYGFLIPHRTDTKIRFYDDEQLKVLLNISLLVKNGKKISKVARLSPDGISEELLKITESTSSKDAFFEIQIDSLIISMIDLDEARFEKTISTCTLKYGFESTMLNVLIPFLSKVGILWSVGEINVAQEHFITNLIRRKIIVAIDTYVATTSPTAKKFLLFLPEGELHELGLLFAKYLIKSRGFRVVYLGQSLPYDDVYKLTERYTPDVILTYFTTGMTSGSIQSYINRLSKDFSDKDVVICGPQVNNRGVALPENVRNIQSIQALNDMLDAMM